MSNNNLLVNLHKFGNNLGIELSKLSLELSEMLNYPSKDTFETFCIVLKCEYRFQVEWTLELGNKLGFANEGSLLGLITTVHGFYSIIF